MATIELKNRSKSAQELIAILTDKNTSMQSIATHGWVDEYEMDLPLIKLYLTHPNCPQNIVYRCVKIAAQKNTSILTIVLTLVFTKFPSMRTHEWEDILGQVYTENMVRFIKVQNKLLMSETLVTASQIAVIFNAAVDVGIGIPVTTPLFREHFICLFNNNNFIPELCFKDTQFVKNKAAIPKSAKYDAIIDAMRSSKNASKLSLYLFNITNNMEYLSQDERDVFFF